MTFYDMPFTSFMGHKMDYDPISMTYSIKGPNGETIIRLDRELMENDIEYANDVADILRKYTSDLVTSIDPEYITDGTVDASTIKSKPDLRDVSTRDLLNEAFRRGAIKQLEMKHVVSKHQLKEYGDDFIKHLHHKLRRDALTSRVDDLEKAGVFHAGKREGGNHPYDDVEFSVDYFICKHPLTLKKEELYANR
jgi:hypothetical protein